MYMTNECDNALKRLRNPCRTQKTYFTRAEEYNKHRVLNKCYVDVNASNPTPCTHYNEVVAPTNKSYHLHGATSSGHRLFNLRNQHLQGKYKGK
jgi:hypothetical protein